MKCDRRKCDRLNRKIDKMRYIAMLYNIFI